MMKRTLVILFAVSFVTFSSPVFSENTEASPEAAAESSEVVKEAVDKTAQTQTRILAVQVEPETENLVIQVEGNFDPILSLEEKETKKDGSDAGTSPYYAVIEGRQVVLDKDLKHNSIVLSDELSASMPDIQSVQMFQLNGDGPDTQPVSRIVLGLRKKLQPQIHSNTGSIITIRFVDPQQKVVVEQPAAVEVPVVKVQPQGDTLSETMPEKQSTELSMTPVRLDESFSIYKAIENPRVDGSIRQAWEMWRNGKSGTARLMLEKYVSKIPEDAVGQYLLVLVYETGNEPEKALESLQKLLAKEKDFMTGWVEAVRLSLVSGKTGEAQTLLGKALQRWPGNMELQYQKGLLLEASGKVAEAKTVYTDILKQNPAHLLSHYRLAMTELQSENLPAAEAELQQVLVADPDDVSSLKALAYIYQQNGRVDKAVSYYQKALTADMLINYGKMLQQQDRPKEALTVFRTAELITADNADAQFTLGIIYSDMKQAPGAIRSMNRFIELSGKDDLRTGKAFGQASGHVAGHSKDPRLSKAQSVLKALENNKSQNTAE